MDRRVQDLRRIPVLSRDGPLGRAVEVLFDDRSWSVRYLVVDRRSELGGRLVLVPPPDITDIDDDAGAIHVSFDLAAAADLLDISRDMPVDRQREAEISRAALFMPFWGGGASGEHVGFVAVTVDPPETGAGVGAKPDPHLRSSADIRGYRVRARGDRIGRIRDLIFDDLDWRIRQLEVRLRSRPPVRSARLPAASVLRVSWCGHAVVLSLDATEIPGVRIRGRRRWSSRAASGEAAADSSLPAGSVPGDREDIPKSARFVSREYLADDSERGWLGT
jgi:hypothetical protein